MDTQIEPRILEAETNQMHKWPNVEEHHNIPFGSLPVVALGLPEVRKSVAEWWRPEHGIVFDEDEVEEENGPTTVTFSRWMEDPVGTHELYRLLYHVCSQGPMRVFGFDRKPIPIRVRVVLDYPLHHVWMTEVTFDASEFGKVFSVAYDMYKHIYELDNAAWGTQSSADVPRIQHEDGYKMLNRARGKYVWGHDITDLVFESLYFSPADDVKPLERDKDYEEPVFLGMIGFGLGS